MGLDFEIKKSRKRENYKGLARQKAHDFWRNCYEAKKLFGETIEFNDTWQVLIKKLSDKFQKVNVCIFIKNLH